MKNNIAKLRHFAFTNNMSKHKTIDLYMLDPKQRGFKTGCQKFLLKIRWSFQVWVSSLKKYSILTIISISSVKYSRVRNKHTPMFINFRNFFQGLWSYYGLKRLKFYYISLHILRGYVYSFRQIFQRPHLFRALE